MIPFDTFTLFGVAAELKGTLLGAKVQKIQQPQANEIALALYGPKGAHRLLVSADSQLFRVHLTEIRRENPIAPPPFCQVCRKYLDGARLDQIVLPRFDRVLQFVFHAQDGERIRLVAEIMGRNANLVLVGGTGVVRGTLRAAHGAERPLRAGGAYADPPGYHDRHDPLPLDTAQIRALLGQNLSASPNERSAAKAALMTTFSGIGAFGADEVLARAGDGGDIAAALDTLLGDLRGGRWDAHAIQDEQGQTDGVWAFTPLSIPSGRRFRRPSLSIALDTFYALRARRTDEAGERTTLTKQLAREITYRDKELQSARTTLAEAARAEGHEQAGNLLLAHLQILTAGAASVVLPDLYSPIGADRTLALDPKRSPLENAQSFFARARKARDAAAYAAGRSENLESERATLLRLQADLERARENEALEAIRNTLHKMIGPKRAGEPAERTNQRPVPRTKDKPFGGHRVRTYTLEGYELLVGESAEANDYLTTRVASPSDLWLHVRAGTGAHGVLRANGKADRLPASVLQRAAEIVAARSGSAVKHGAIVAVDVVEKRHVRKPRGAKPGLVTYTGERTLDVTPRL